MTTQSGKAKGRRLQQLICKGLLEIGKQFDLVADDIASRGMGQSGTDVILSPAAKKIFGKLAVEAKNREALNVTTVFWEHAGKYPGYISLLVHKRNHTDPLCTLKLSEFLAIFERGLNVNG